MASTTPELPTQFPCLCRAVYSWDGGTKRDLVFVEGDLVECLNAGDGSWWMGRLRRDKRMVGLFPSNYVVVLDDSLQPTSRATKPMPELHQSQPRQQKSNLRKPNDMALEQNILLSTTEPTPDDIVIAVMGPTGSGKTAFISCFDPLLPVVIPISYAYVVDDRFKIYQCFDVLIGKFYLVDSPGYQASVDRGRAFSGRLRDWIWASKVRLTGIVFLYSILESEFPDNDTQILSIAGQIFRELSSSQVVLATTFWDRVGEDIGMKYENRLKASVGLMTNTVDQVFRQDKGIVSARAIIEHLVRERTAARSSSSSFIKMAPKSGYYEYSRSSSEGDRVHYDPRKEERRSASLSKTNTDRGNVAKPTPVEAKSYQDKMNLPASQTGQESSAKFLEGKAQPDRRLANEARNLNNDIAATIGTETKSLSKAKYGRKQRPQEVWDERTKRDDRAKAEEPRMGELVREEVKELDMRQESTSMPFYPPTDNSPRDLGYLLWKLRNIARPRLAQGFRRIEWLCDCGEIQYGDFDNTDPDAVSLLEVSLQRPTGDVPSPGVGAASTALRTPAAVHFENSSTQRPMPVAPNPGHVPIPVTQTSSQPGPPVIAQLKYLELCINHGKLERRLGEVDVSNISSDGQLFRQIKRTYDTVRGYRSKWFLLEPISIQFVEFGLEERHRVIIYPSEGSWPPPSAVTAGEWEYECPPRPPPPIPAHHFLHLMNDTRPHPRTIWMRRLPKKLMKSMMLEPGDIPTGWGVYIVEGLNQRVVAQIFLYFTVVVVIVSIFWSLWRRDLQGGMGLGSFALAGAVLLGFALQVEFYGQLADFAR